MLSFSIAVNVGVVVPPVNVAARVSVPPAPLSVSIEPKVAKLPALPPNEPSKKSEPVLLAKLLTPVVSDQIQIFVTC